MSIHSRDSTFAESRSVRLERADQYAALVTERVQSVASRQGVAPRLGSGPLTVSQVFTVAKLLKVKPAALMPDWPT